MCVYGKWCVCVRCMNCAVCVSLVSGVFWCEVCALRSVCMWSVVFVRCVHCAVCVSGELCARVKYLHCGMCVW